MRTASFRHIPHQKSPLSPFPRVLRVLSSTGSKRHVVVVRKRFVDELFGPLVKFGVVTDLFLFEFLLKFPFREFRSSRFHFFGFLSEWVTHRDPIAMSECACGVHLKEL